MAQDLAAAFNYNAPCDGPCPTHFPWRG